MSGVPPLERRITAFWRQSDETTLGDLIRMTTSHLTNCESCSSIDDVRNRIVSAANHAAEEEFVSGWAEDFELDLTKENIDTLLSECGGVPPMDEELAALDPDDLVLQLRVVEVLRRHGRETTEAPTWVRRIRERDLQFKPRPIPVHPGQLRIA